MDAPLALYRRYRPETFAEVIGQEHVTEPLRAALAGNRVNHAYLFSGPRGCGKTTSARILARALNCEQAPVADPCGECDSCRDLSRNGPGSIDVIEIDAASHGGVDDARDLREKAFFAPVRSRYKVYIIDEAHMVTTQGFNALLKLVEEPPPHLRFIFATTEPEKVLPTIRSRTHHYPFRLIPPRLLSSYLSDLCEREGVAIEPAALPLVVRSGAGSARDSLSVLDQLIGGAGSDGVTYALAAGLLGHTPDALLDDIIEAFAAGDGATVFGVVDRVIETGQDPRRFTEDLLRRLRDLVIVTAVPDAPATGLIDVSEDAGDRLVAQAARFGAAELSRAADLVATGLTEMRGATAPRLLLELICARVLLPGADHDRAGMLARLERLERRAAIGGTAAPAVDPPTPATAAQAPSTVGRTPEVAPGAVATEPVAPGPRETPGASSSPAHPAAPAEPVATSPAPAIPTDPAVEPAPTGSTGAALSLVDVRRLWPDIVENVKTRRRLTWIHLTQHAQVVAVDAVTLTLGFSNAGARDSFDGGGSAEIVRQAAIEVVGADWRVESILDPGAEPPPSPSAAAPTPLEAAPVSGSPPAETRPGVALDASSSASAVDPRSDTAADPAAPEAAAGSDQGASPPPAAAAAREAISQTREPGTPGRDHQAAADAGASPDDEDADLSGLAGTELLQQHLGAQVIEEIKHH